MHLMVISDFDGHTRGEVITNPALVAAIQASSHAACVVAVPSDPPAEETAPAPSVPVED